MGKRKIKGKKRREKIIIHSTDINSRVYYYKSGSSTTKPTLLNRITIALYLYFKSYYFGFSDILVLKK